MGAPMLAALADAGFPARGLDLKPPESYGCLAPRMTDDPAAFAEGLQILFTVVRDEAETDALLFGPHGLARAPDLRTVAVCSTLSPRYVRGLRAQVPGCVALVDAPMSGAEVAARERRLTFMLGGDEADLDDLMPLLAAMGTQMHRMGPYGSGMAAKVLNNLLAASHTAMTRLVLDWADAVGIGEERLLALIGQSSGQNWLASGFDEIEFARDGWARDNTIGILVKDVGAALDAAPPGADPRLPLAVQAALRGLSRRARGEA